ncbi:hypothetical protein [Desulfohalovibrio reitneri]|uniref:hypothetical protein n=1 Tax=Desulfohalovibrio reitneri TaxID=1307759 RepID=UPI0004A76D0A|nr:hypothetical protein [Desulfohalovibrio reitneri]
MDREYLRTFQETFHIIRLTPEAGTVLLAALLLAVAALVAGIWFNRRLQSRLKDIPANWIVSPARIRDILQTAIDQRAKVEMLLDGAATRTRFLTSQAVELSDESLRLELSGAVTLSSDWKDRAVEAFLRVRERGEKQLRFYGFTSRLAGMRVDSQGFGLVDVYLPQRLEIRQKRMHLRIEPPRGWSGGSRSGPKTASPPNPRGIGASPP